MRDLKHVTVEEGPSRGMRLRVLLLGAAFMVLLAGVLFRAAQLQVQEKERLKGFAEDQYVRAMEIPARRGDIFDRRGTPLAQSVEVDSAWVDPTRLPDPQLAAAQLSRALGVDARELRAKLEKGRRFVWVKRQVSASEAAKVKELQLPGLGFAREPRRYYPQRELAAHLIGLVGTDARGLEGLERSFEDELSGEQVLREGFRDAKGRRLLTNGIEDPQERQGASLTLTIDRQIQYVTERALERAVALAKGAAGVAVVLDPKTGEVLAMANSPTFNPNTPQHIRREALRNRAVTDAFEPGSTMKAFVVAGALDARCITDASEFDCERGRWAVGQHVIHDSHPYALLRPRGILQVSSNICAAKIAQKLGRDGLSEALARFGFGERPAMGLWGEARGSVPFPKAEIVLATQAFGQGLSATAVQIAAGYGALANGGVLMRPYLVSKVVDPDGVLLLENRPVAVRRAVSAKAAAQVLAMLESVVEPEGTAPKAFMEEYRVAGKTGTAQKADPVAGGYSEKRMASFVGIVPAEAPRVVILVVIDEPQGDVYGGLVAAPAFKEIASQVMPYLGVPPSRPGRVVPQQKPNSVAQSPVVAAIERMEEMDTVTESTVADGTVRVPDVHGRSGRVAVTQLLGAALEPHVKGSGHVVKQRPLPGTLVDRGTRITLELARHLPTLPP